MTREDRKNAYLYCKFRDEQFALYDEYAKRHGMLMKTLLVANVLYYAKDGMTETPENRRNKIVRMTEAGREYCGQAVRHITWAEDTAMSLFSAEEQKQLIALSRKFTENLTVLINQETEEAEA